MPSFNCSNNLETQVLLCNICPCRLLVQFFRGTFQRKGLVLICFSCLRDILRSRAEANAACYQLFLHNQTVSISILSAAPFLKTDIALCCITKHVMPKCWSQFEGMHDFWTSTRTIYKGFQI